MNNIEVVDGKVDFDDRPEKTKHSVTQIKIGVPFISSLPSYVDITVKPEFSAVVNGAPFHLAGDTKPFKESRESTLAIDIDKLEIAKYLEYSPVGLNFTLPSGQLSGKLTAGFRTSTNNPSVLSITGNLGIKDLDMRQTGGAPLLKLPSIEVLIEAFQVFANKMALKSIKADGLDFHLNRGRDGSLNVANLVATSAEPKPAETKEPKKEGAPFGFSIEEIALNSATLHFTDEQPQHPYKTQLDNIVLKVTGLTNEPGKKAGTELSFESEAKEKFSHSGTLQLAPLLAEGKLEIEGLKPGCAPSLLRNRRGCGNQRRICRFIDAVYFCEQRRPNRSQSVGLGRESAQFPFGPGRPARAVVARRVFGDQGQHDGSGQKNHRHR